MGLSIDYPAFPTKLMNTGIQLLIRQLETQFQIKVKIKELNDYMHFLYYGTIQTSITRSHSFTNHLLYKRLVFSTRSVIYFLSEREHLKSQVVADDANQYMYLYANIYEQLSVTDEGGSQSGGFTRNTILTNEPE